MRIVNFSDARSRLKTILDEVTADADYTIITRRDADDVVVMSLDNFNALAETTHLLNSPANRKQIMASIKQSQEEALIKHKVR